MIDAFRGTSDIFNFDYSKGKSSQQLSTLWFLLHSSAKELNIWVTSLKIFTFNTYFPLISYRIQRHYFALHTEIFIVITSIIPAFYKLSQFQSYLKRKKSIDLFPAIIYAPFWTVNHLPFCSPNLLIKAWMKLNIEF